MAAHKIVTHLISIFIVLKKYLYDFLILTIGIAVAIYIKQNVTIIITLHFFKPCPIRLFVLGNTESTAKIIARNIIVTALIVNVTVAIMYQLV